MHHYPDVGVVVVCFLVGFFYPACEVWAGCVFAFDDDAAVVGVADVGDVAAIFSAGFDSSVYAVVEIVPEEISNLALKSGAGLFGAVSVSCHLWPF